MGRFNRESFIIQDKDVLRDDYQPETLEERDEELDEYAAALRPVIQGWQPNNVFLYGVTGVGKTAATHDLLEELQASAEEYDDVDLNVIELNCTGCTTSYQVAVNLVNEIRSPSHPLTTVSSTREPMSETGYQQNGSSTNSTTTLSRLVGPFSLFWTRSITSARMTIFCTSFHEHARN